MLGDNMNKVIVNIKSVQKTIGEEDGIIEFVTEGEVTFKNDSLYVLYKESELSGMEGNTTTLKIHGDTVIMKRYGSASSKIEYKVGHECTSQYHTPYGVFNLITNTKELMIDIKDNKEGKINIAYDMKIENLMESYNK